MDSDICSMINICHTEMFMIKVVFGHFFMSEISENIHNSCLGQNQNLR